MQELLVDFIPSLDGYGAAEGWPGFWGLQGPEYLAWLGEQPERVFPYGCLAAGQLVLRRREVPANSHLADASLQRSCAERNEQRSHRVDGATSAGALVR